ncbi:SET domain-containing protein [Marasmius fiardii PR-910]|nr:SET domain-containing protein [Marasmius fiardii PR-910]
MASPSRLGPTLRLNAHPQARDQCTASVSFSPGSVILSVPSFGTALLPSQKSRRCDSCHRLGTPSQLKKCSGCASFWYCDEKCEFFAIYWIFASYQLPPGQTNHWTVGHKKICKHYNKVTASPQFSGMAVHEQMDALLLSAAVARIEALKLSLDDKDSPLHTFMSLIPGPVSSPHPPLTLAKSSLSTDTINGLFSRFGNNNFSIHSHFHTYGHGIFPLASRLFNHSCIPNAAAKYVITSGESVRMDVVALRSISVGEEISLPYIDPALVQTRPTVFRLTYGFICRCPSCTVLDSIGEVPEPPKDEDRLRKISKELQDFIAVHRAHLPLFTGDLGAFPSSLYCVLHESYLAALSERFSTAAHDGSYDAALESGTTLTALYRLIYPPNYPQIGVVSVLNEFKYNIYPFQGLHLLEFSKTAWNKIVSTNSKDEWLRDQMRTALCEADHILALTLGKEGDEGGGPCEEIKTLKNLLVDEKRSLGLA